MIFKNKVFIIIGSEGQIGKVFKKHILYNGGKICSVDILKKRKKKDINEFYIKTNITNLKSIKRILNKTKKLYKKIDCVINCSYPKLNQSKNLNSINFKKITRNISDHLGSNIVLCKITADFFKKQGHGNIILLSSIQGVMPPKFEHYENTNMYSPIEYTANKHAIVGIVKYYAKLYGKFNININSISPGGIKNNQNKNFLKKYSKFCSNNNLLKSSDLNGIIEFLISDYSKKITGQDFVIDDGFSL